MGILGSKCSSQVPEARKKGRQAKRQAGIEGWWEITVQIIWGSDVTAYRGRVLDSRWLGAGCAWQTTRTARRQAGISGPTRRLLGLSVPGGLGLLGGSKGRHYRIKCAGRDTV